MCVSMHTWMDGWMGARVIARIEYVRMCACMRRDDVCMYACMQTHTHAHIRHTTHSGVEGFHQRLADLIEARAAETKKTARGRCQVEGASGHACTHTPVFVSSNASK